MTRARTLGMLGPTVEVVAVYHQQRFCLLRLAEFAEILLEIEEPARLKLRQKMRQLKKDLYHLRKSSGPLNLNPLTPVALLFFELLHVAILTAPERRRRGVPFSFANPRCPISGSD